MRYKAVIGLGYGDEGKGVVTNYLCSTMPDTLVVRFNGGHQVGHTVERQGYRHVFANFGSGTLLGNATYWSRNCTVEPMGLLNELEILREHNIEPRLYIDAECPITTPYDIMGNRLDTNAQKNGTCGVGFGNTINRENKLYHLHYLDLHYPAVFQEKLDRIKDYYRLNTRVNKFMECCRKVVEDREIQLAYKIRPWDNYVYEGSQGLMLDQHIGFYPNVTWSNTGTKNLPKKRNFDFYLVTRAYQTRHGNGFMSNDDDSHLEEDPLETNVHNNYQGYFRRGILDVDMLIYGILNDKRLRTGKERRFLVITCLDHVKKYKVIFQGRKQSFKSEDDFVGFINHKLERAGISIYNVIRFRRKDGGEIYAY